MRALLPFFSNISRLVPMVLPLPPVYECNVSRHKLGPRAPVKPPWQRAQREPQLPGRTWKQLLRHQQLFTSDQSTHVIAGRTKQLTAEQGYQPRQNGVDPMLQNPATTTRNLTASRPAPPRHGEANRRQQSCLNLQWITNSHSNSKPQETPSTGAPPPK